MARVTRSEASGDSSGCVFTPSETEGTLASSCVESLEACNSSDFAGDESSAICNGDYLYIGCAIDQPWAFDCASFGGSCSDNACIFPDGSVCDGRILKCAEGLSCTNMDDNGFGRCAAAE